MLLDTSRELLHMWLHTQDQDQRLLVNHIDDSDLLDLDHMVYGAHLLQIVVNCLVFGLVEEMEGFGVLGDFAAAVAAVAAAVADGCGFCMSGDCDNLHLDLVFLVLGCWKDLMCIQ